MSNNSLININTHIKNIKLDNPFINSSGCLCSTKDDLDLLGLSNTGAIMSKSSTMDLRMGNPLPRYWDNQDFSINSMGLPNQGIQSYCQYAIKSKKPYFISLSGLSLQENTQMLFNINKHLESNGNISKLVGVELNLSCPNIVGHSQIGYDFEHLEDYLNSIFEKDINKMILFGLKLPPYFEIHHFGIMADILKKFNRLDFLTCINSIGNGLVIDTETEMPVIKPKHGFGGLGGSIIKPTGLANVNQFYNLLGDRVSIIGCGGIKTGEDVFQYLLAGASVVSVGTQLMLEGPAVFNKLEYQLKQLMTKKDYINLSQIIGKLKYQESEETKFSSTSIDFMNKSFKEGDFSLGGNYAAYY
tara:strand:+ start:176 stop:1249 length:1074 start_codon:yes stop_codon:yes gene_type:complete